jgi:phage terminase large subunit-like protein
MNRKTIFEDENANPDGLVSDIIAFTETLKLASGSYVGKPVVLREWQKDIIREIFGYRWQDNNLRSVRTALFTIARKNAKALALDTPIPTPNGWSTMGDLQEGDFVYGTSGKPVKVIATSEVFENHDCYKLTFSDGSSVVADAGHVWTVLNARRKAKNLTTDRVFETYLHPRSDGKRETVYTIPPKQSLIGKQKHLPIPPYTLGVWLGDGKNQNATVYIWDEDLSILDSISEEGLTTTIQESTAKDSASGYWLNFEGVPYRDKTGRSFQSVLRREKLLSNKHIPEKYLFSSKTQRWNLLQGLMDTDGTVSKRGQCSFCSCNETLAKDVLLLVRSLGLKATFKTRIAEIKSTGYKTEAYYVQFWASRLDHQIFRLERKQSRLKEKISRGNTIRISNVEWVPSVPTKCISVDSEDHLFLAGHGYIPTHNTELTSMLALSAMCVQGLAQLNGQIIVCANDREQAGITFRAMATMIRQDVELVTLFNIIDSRKKIIYVPLNISCEIVPAVAASLHGLNPYLVIEDEAGNWPGEKGREIHTVLNTAFGAQSEPLTILLSTQSPNDVHFFSELVDYGIRVNSGEINDPTFKAFIYALPLTDDYGKEIDIWDEKNWYIANPALGDFRSLEDMRNFAEKAKKIPTLEAKFRNLFLNQRISAHTPFLSKTIWMGCGNSDMPGIDEFEGCDIYLGLDLSAKRDLTCLSVAIPVDIEVEEGMFSRKVFVYNYFYMPGDGIDEKSENDRVPYATWAKQGWLNIDSTKVVHYGYVAKKVAELHSEFNIVALGFDRWRIDEFKRECENLGLDFEEEMFIPIGQGFKDMDPCVEAFEDYVSDGKLVHAHNPILTWCVSNTVVTLDPAENRKFDKSKSYGRIDGTVSTAMALRLVRLDELIEDLGEQDVDLLIV